MVSNISSALNAYQQALGRISSQEQKSLVQPQGAAEEASSGATKVSNISGPIM